MPDNSNRNFAQSQSLASALHKADIPGKFKKTALKLLRFIRKSDIGLACLLSCIYFAAVPLTITINESGNSFLKILTLPIAAYCAVSIFFYRQKIQLNFVHFASFLFLITVVMTLFADRSALSLRYVRGYFETFGLMFLMTMRKYSQNEMKAFEAAQLVLLGIMIALGFIGADWYGSRNTMVIFGATCDPNYFTGFFILPMAVALKKMRESRLWAIVCMVMLALGFYIVLSSGSRGGLLAVIVTIGSYVFITAKGAKQRFVGMLVALVAAVVLWAVIIPILPESVSSRFSIQSLIESRGTSRGDIWVSMLSTIKSSTWELLYGRGIFAQHEIFIAGKMAKMVAHNQFIQALYNQGIPGLVAFLLMSGAAVLRNLKKRPYISAAMLGTLALAMTLTINTSIKTFWNLLIYAAFSFDYLDKSKGDQTFYDVIEKIFSIKI